MQAAREYSNLGKDFWANVRSLSQLVGYTVRKEDKIKIPAIQEIKKAYEEVGLSYSHLLRNDDELTPLGRKVVGYFEYRAKVLNEQVAPLLMDVKKAKKTFTALRLKLSPSCHVPMNKQKGKKRAPAYFTGIINMLIESRLNGEFCDYNPRKLTTITKDGKPLRTLARWVDGAFPSPVNPIAVWEIKEYYYTTTFGSRIADGVYESLLDGMELEELREHEEITVLHYLMVDAYDTWWKKGKSYLCRLIDMLHMGYVDEILFGQEVLERLPALVDEWINISKTSQRREKTFRKNLKTEA